MVDLVKRKMYNAGELVTGGPCNNERVGKRCSY